MDTNKKINAATEQEILISIRNLQKYFPIKKSSLFQKEQEFVHANEDITLDIHRGETLGLVGESGSGKSTLGRTIVQLYDQTAGATLYYGNTIEEVAPKYARDIIKNMPKLFPEYLKEEEELIKLQENVYKVSEKDELERGKAEADVAEKMKEVNNKYRNIMRIAGGLVVHPDLNKVSSALSDSFKTKVEIANLKRELDKKEMIAKSPKRRKNSKGIEKDIAKLNKQIADLEEAVKPKDQHIEDLRKEASDKPRFSEFEFIRNDGVDLSKLTTEEMRILRRDLQFIFQDPYSSLNPRMTVGQIIGEGIIAHGIFKSNNDEGYQDYIQTVMEQCGLEPYFIHRYPHQFSGGQRQRIGIARALALRPKFIVCDEAVSALDVSIQSQIINLLQDLKDEFNLTYLFITHDLSVVKYISDRVAVMYLGHIVELSDSEDIFENPLHPYTQALLEAIPRTDVDGKAHELQILEGDIPSAVRPPKGCKFSTRCKYAHDKCFEIDPELVEITKGHYAACHLLDDNNEAV